MYVDLMDQLDSFILNKLAHCSLCAYEIAASLDGFLSRYHVSLLTIANRLNELQLDCRIACISPEADPYRGFFLLRIPVDEVPMFNLDDELIDTLCDDLALVPNKRNNDNVFLSLDDGADTPTLHVCEDELVIFELDVDDEELIAELQQSEESSHTDEEETEIIDATLDSDVNGANNSIDEIDEYTNANVFASEERADDIDHATDTAADSVSNNGEGDVATEETYITDLDESDELPSAGDAQENTAVDDMTEGAEGNESTDIDDTDTQPTDESTHSNAQNEADALAQDVDRADENTHIQDNGCDGGRLDAQNLTAQAADDVPQEEHTVPLPEEDVSDAPTMQDQELDQDQSDEKNNAEQAEDVDEQADDTDVDLVDLDDLDDLIDIDEVEDESSEEVIIQNNEDAEDQAEIDADIVSLSAESDSVGESEDGESVEIDTDTPADEESPRNAEESSVDAYIADDVSEQEEASEETSDVDDDDDDILINDLSNGNNSVENRIDVLVEGLDDHARDDAEPKIEAAHVAEQAADDAIEDADTSKTTAQHAQVTTEQVVDAARTNVAAAHSMPISYAKNTSEQVAPAEVQDDDSIADNRANAASVQYENEPNYDEPIRRTAFSRADIQQELSENPEMEKRRLASMRLLGLIPDEKPSEQEAASADETASDDEQVEDVQEAPAEPEQVYVQSYSALMAPRTDLEYYLKEVEAEHHYAYKSMLHTLFNTPAPKVEEDVDTKISTQTYANMSEFREEMRKKGYEVRQYVVQHTVQYYSRKYINVNSIRFAASMIAYLVALALIAIGYFVCDRYAHLGYVPYLSTAIALLCIPGYCGVRYIAYRDKHAPANFSFKLSLATSFMVAIILMMVFLLIAFFNPSSGANISDVNSLVAPIIYPAVMLLLLPIYVVIYALLYRTNKFHVIS